jgi:hypothetical protein
MTVDNQVTAAGVEPSAWGQDCVAKTDSVVQWEGVVEPDALVNNFGGSE